MIVLRSAALVAAITTVTLNAMHGFKATPVLEIAVLFAAFQAALDVAKCALIGAGIEAWRHRRYALTVLAFLLFPALFFNSVWSAASQVLVLRDRTMTQSTADRETRQRQEAEHARMTRELATMQASPTFTATAACALPKSTDARAYCAKVEQTKTALAKIAATLATTTAPDPEPHVTTLAAAVKASATDVRLVLALMPVLLAELIASVGFVIARAATPDAASKPSKTPLRARLRSWLGRWRPTVGNAPAGTPEASQRHLAATSSTPVIAWPGSPRA